jgi:hypothetical protein
MTDGQVLWLNVTNAILGLLVALPVAVVLVAILVEIIKRPWKHPLSSAGHRIDWHRIAHLGRHG